MAGVWIVAETREQALELLAAGRSLAPDIGKTLTAVLGSEAGPPEEYISRGADEVFLLAHLAAGESFGAHLPVIEHEARTGSPDLILFSASARGKELSARLAARLGCGLCSGCTAIFFDKQTGTVLMERIAYGGAAVQKLTSSAWPVIVTVPPRSFAPPPPLGRQAGQDPEVARTSPFRRAGPRKETKGERSEGHH